MRTDTFMLIAAMLAASTAQAAVKLTALNIISTDAAGKIQGVGAHRFKTRSTAGIRRSS